MEVIKLPEAIKIVGDKKRKIQITYERKRYYNREMGAITTGKWVRYLKFLEPTECLMVYYFLQKAIDDQKTKSSPKHRRRLTNQSLIDRLIRESMRCEQS